MTLTRKQRLSDYLPLAALWILAILLLYDVANNHIGLFWKHYLGLSLLSLTTLLMVINHRLGVYALGLLLFLALVGVVAFQESVTVTTYRITIAGLDIPLFYGQLLYVPFVVAHAILSQQWYKLKKSSTV